MPSTPLKRTSPGPADASRRRVAVGIDLIDVVDVADSLRIFGDRYLERVYTSAERRQTAGDPRRLAACFSAKEAVLKALAVLERPPWTSVEILEDVFGGHEVVLHGAVAAHARAAHCTVDVAAGRDRCLAVATLG